MPGDPAFDRNANPQPQTTPPPATPQPDERMAALERTVAGLAESNQKLTQQLTQFAQSVTQRFNQQPAAPEPTPTTADDDEAARMLDNPRAYFSQLIEESLAKALPAWYKENVGPVHATQLQDAGDTHIAAERTKFDSIYGAGKFDELIYPSIQRQLESLGDRAVVARASRATVHEMVNYAAGDKIEELMAARQAQDKAAAEAQQAKENQMTAPYLLPPSLRPPRKGELTEADQSMIARARALGTDDFADLDSLVALKDRISDGLASQPYDSLGFGLDVGALVADRSKQNAASSS